MFDESKHKRKPKGSSDGGQFIKSSDGSGGTHEETPAETKRLNEIGISEPKLSRQEWAMFYRQLGDIKNGAYVDRLPNSDMVIPVETSGRGVLIISSGEYGEEKVKSIYMFRDKDFMYDMIERLKNGD